MFRINSNLDVTKPNFLQGVPDDLIYVTLTCEDANSKLVEALTVDDVDDEDRVGNSLLQICKLKFGYKAKLSFRL